MIKDKWEHIGDGVYICFDGYGFMLHANSHIDPTDKIYLDWEVAQTLINKINEDHRTNEDVRKNIL